MRHSVRSKDCQDTQREWGKRKMTHCITWLSHSAIHLKDIKMVPIIVNEWCHKFINCRQSGLAGDESIIRRPGNYIFDSLDNTNIRMNSTAINDCWSRSPPFESSQLLLLTDIFYLLNSTPWRASDNRSSPPILTEDLNQKKKNWGLATNLLLRVAWRIGF